MLEIAQSNATIGIVGCRLERGRNVRPRLAAIVPYSARRAGHFTRIGRSKRAPARLAQYRAPEVESGPVDAVNGAFMLIRRRALDEVGMFDEGYWMYMEDLDLCYRFRQWITWYDPDVTVLHVKGGTSGRHRKPRLDYAFHYGMLRFYRKHYAATRNPLLNLAVYLGIGVKFVISLITSATRRRVASITNLVSVLLPSYRDHEPCSDHFLESSRVHVRLEVVLLNNDSSQLEALQDSWRRSETRACAFSISNIGPGSQRPSMWASRRRPENSSSSQTPTCSSPVVTSTNW